MKKFLVALVLSMVSFVAIPSHAYDDIDHCRIEAVMIGASGATAIIAPLSLGLVAVIAAHSANDLAAERNQPLYYVIPVAIGGLAIMSVPLTLSTLGFVLNNSEECLERFGR